MFIRFLCFFFRFVRKKRIIIRNMEFQEGHPALGDFSCQGTTHSLVENNCKCLQRFTVLWGFLCRLERRPRPTRCFPSLRYRKPARSPGPRTSKSSSRIPDFTSPAVAVSAKNWTCSNTSVLKEALMAMLNTPANTGPLIFTYSATVLQLNSLRSPKIRIGFHILRLLLFLT